MQASSKQTVIKPQSHDDAVSGVVYSAEFDMLITCSVDSVVRVWHAKTGELSFHFSGAHGIGAGARITAMCLDAEGRRLITGAHNGEVHMVFGSVYAWAHTLSTQRAP